MGAGAVRNSIGAFSDALSIVIDLPCVRVVGTSCCDCWVVGVETTLLGGASEGGMVVETPGRGGRGGGGIMLFIASGLGGTSKVGDRSGSAGRVSPVS